MSKFISGARWALRVAFESVFSAVLTSTAILSTVGTFIVNNMSTLQVVLLAVSVLTVSLLGCWFMVKNLERRVAEAINNRDAVYNRALFAQKAITSVDRCTWLKCFADTQFARSTASRDDAEHGKEVRRQIMVHLTTHRDQRGGFTLDEIEEELDQWCKPL